MLYFTIDILGTIAFSISGVLVAMEKKLDLFGVFVIAFVTSVGGGTIRDIIIGDTPVTWLKEPVYLYTILATVALSILFYKYLKYLKSSIFLFDTIGIGLYTMVGVEKGIDASLSPVMCVALGTVTATFGGVIRDILCTQIPVIFRKEVYATACIIGGTGYFIMTSLGLQEVYAYVAAIVIVIVIRLISVKYKIALPLIYK